MVDPSEWRHHYRSALLDTHLDYRRFESLPEAVFDNPLGQL
jgi:hypothetical protein